MNAKQGFFSFSDFQSQKLTEFGLLPLCIVMIISLMSSFLLFYLYAKFFKVRATGSRVHRTFPLLGPSITGIFICIQFSLPLSLGLLGALSIVRFRTPIKEPEEIGFIMVVVATSICSELLTSMDWFCPGQTLLRAQ